MTGISWGRIPVRVYSVGKSPISDPLTVTSIGERSAFSAKDRSSSRLASPLVNQSRQRDNAGLQKEKFNSTYYIGNMCT